MSSDNGIPNIDIETNRIDIESVTWDRYVRTLGPTSQLLVIKFHLLTFSSQLSPLNSTHLISSLISQLSLLNFLTCNSESGIFRNPDVWNAKLNRFTFI